jgi:hypothetical protein
MADPEVFVIIYCHGCVTSNKIQVPTGMTIIKKNIAYLGDSCSSTRMHGETRPQYLMSITDSMLIDFENCRPSEAEYIAYQQGRITPGNTPCQIQRGKPFLYDKEYTIDDNPSNSHLRNILIIIRNPDGSISRFNVFDKREFEGLLRQFSNSSKINDFIQHMFNSKSRTKNSLDPNFFKKLTTGDLLNIFKFIEAKIVKIQDFSCNGICDPRATIPTITPDIGYGGKSKRRKKNKRKSKRNNKKRN